jgi:hypothetical protein
VFGDSIVVLFYVRVRGVGFSCYCRSLFLERGWIGLDTVTEWPG